MGLLNEWAAFMRIVKMNNRQEKGIICQALDRISRWDKEHRDWSGMLSLEVHNYPTRNVMHVQGPG